MNLPDAQADYSAFALIEPVSGISLQTPAQSLSLQPHAARIWNRRTGKAELEASDIDTSFTADGRCTVRCLTTKPYLQCEVWFPEATGQLRVRHAGKLVDQADLIDGWQTVAVELKDVSEGAELALEFCDSKGAPVDAVRLRRIALADDWGKGQRKRLKCYLPFTFMGIFEDFSVYPCCARQWMKDGQLAGNTKTDNLRQIWNGPKFQEMRKNFLDGEYGATCREQMCPYLTGELRPSEIPAAAVRAINEGLTELEYGPISIHHDIDRGCNLDCIMCRDEKTLPNPTNIAHAIADIEAAIDMGSMAGLSFSGAGEPFASKKVIQFLASDALSSKNVLLAVTTNLTYFDERLWAKISHNHFSSIIVSADGCSEQTYDKIRLGSKWTTIEKNLRLLSRLKREGKIGSLTWNYTILRQNVCDVANAIALADDLGFDSIRFIAQIQALKRTNGNMFEDYDENALDELYRQFLSTNAFNNPRVMLGETAMLEQRYRSVDFKLDSAEHILNRRSYSGNFETPISLADVRKCIRLTNSAMDDLGKDGVSASLGVGSLHFLRSFAQSNFPASSAFYKVPFRMPAKIGFFRAKRRVAAFLDAYEKRTQQVGI